jgi:hypothetical protein
MQKDYFDIGVPFVAGGVVFLLAFYLLGLIVPANVAWEQVTSAVVHDRAISCHKAVVAHLAEIGDTTDLKVTGMESRAMRDELAAEFTVDTDDVSRDRLVRQACSEMLNA